MVTKFVFKVGVSRSAGWILGLFVESTKLPAPYTIVSQWLLSTYRSNPGSLATVFRVYLRSGIGARGVVLKRWDFTHTSAAGSVMLSSTHFGVFANKLRSWWYMQKRASWTPICTSYVGGLY